jgi:hypothetical protein
LPIVRQFVLQRIAAARILNSMKVAIVPLFFLGLSTLVAQADVCNSSAMATNLESLKRVTPKGWDTSIKPTERIVGISDDTPACEILLRDPRPDSAITENTSKHRGDGVKIAPSFLLWIIELTSSDRKNSVMLALSHRPMQLQTAFPKVLASNEGYLVLILGSAGTTWPDAQKDILRALSLPASKSPSSQKE